MENEVTDTVSRKLESRGMNFVAWQFQRLVFEKTTSTVACRPLTPALASHLIAFSPSIFSILAVEVGPALVQTRHRDFSFQRAQNVFAGELLQIRIAPSRGESICCVQQAGRLWHKFSVVAVLTSTLLSNFRLSAPFISVLTTQRGRAATQKLFVSGFFEYSG